MIEQKRYDMAGALAYDASVLPLLPDPSPDGHTPIFVGVLDPSFNEGHTHYVRVKWYD